MNKVKRVAKSIKTKILSLNTKRVTVLFVAAAFVIGGVASVFWYSDVYMTTERRFWSAIDNAMSTSSVTRTLTQGGSGNQVVQTSRFNCSPEDFSRNKVEFTNKSATVDTRVVTEGITTLDSQYSRYIAFETNDTRADGSVANLDGVLGRWAGETQTGDQASIARQNYVSELVTLAIFGDFSQVFRQEIVTALQDSNAYEINDAGVEEVEVDDQNVVAIPVTVKLKA